MYVYRYYIFNKNYIIQIVLISIIFYNNILDLILNNPVTKRISLLILNGVFDASTNERLMIFSRSFSNIDSLYLFFGIGTGYFDNFQETLVGERVAAHNNLLLHFIEGGVLMIIIYICHILYSYNLIRSIRDINLKRMLLLIFINIEIFGIINNNYYYFIPYFLYIILLHTSTNNINERI